jgi:xanthosine utilization system XapX-like protein
VEAYPARRTVAGGAFCDRGSVDREFSKSGAQEPAANPEVREDMLESLKNDLEKMREDRPGERFKNEHRRAEKRGLRQGWMRVALLAGALVCILIGVVLVFIPGPAFVFFILAGALVAIQWWPAAKALDRAEKKVWPVWHRIKARFTRKKSGRHGKGPDAAESPEGLR